LWASPISFSDAGVWFSLLMAASGTRAQPAAAFRNPEFSSGPEKSTRIDAATIGFDGGSARAALRSSEYGNMKFAQILGWNASGQRWRNLIPLVVNRRDKIGNWMNHHYNKSDGAIRVKSALQPY
jgi:hypothetical protein